MSSLPPHPNIVRLLYAVIINDAVAYVVLDRVIGTNLTVALNNCPSKKGFPEARVCGFVRQLVDALAHCHAHNVMHHDVSLGNILLEDGTDRVVLCDFGYAWMGDLTCVPLARGAPLFAAPEVLRSKLHSTAADVWSLAVVAFFLLTGRSPFPKDTMSGFLDAVLGPTVRLGTNLVARNAEAAQPVVFHRNERVSAAAIDALVTGILERRRFPQQRLTTKQLRAHKWLSASSTA